MHFFSMSHVEGAGRSSVLRATLAGGIVLLAGTAACVAPAGADDGDAPEPTAVAESAVRSGYIDLVRYCQTNFGAGASAVLLSGTDAYRWRCQVGSTQYEMDLQKACVQQYGAGSEIRLESESDPYSWFCTVPYRPPEDPCAHARNRYCCLKPWACN